MKPKGFDIVERFQWEYRRRNSEILCHRIVQVFVDPEQWIGLEMTTKDKTTITWFRVAENDELTGRNGTTWRLNRDLSTWACQTELKENDWWSKTS